MVLFGATEPLFVLFVLVGGIAVIAYKAHLYLYRPAQWIAQQQAKADKEAKIEAAKLENKGKGVGNVLGGILGGVLKNRPH